MLTLAIIGAVVLTTTVVIFWNMPTKEDNSSLSLRGRETTEAIYSGEIASSALRASSQ